MGLWEGKKYPGMVGRGEALSFHRGNIRQILGTEVIIDLDPPGTHPALSSKGLDPEAAEDA